MRDVWLGLLLLAAPPDGAAPEKKPAVPLYTNDDLARVAPFRNQTGIASIPAVGAVRETPPRGPSSPPRGRGEAYWRREGERVRQQVRKIEAQEAAVRARMEAERARPHRSKSARRGPDLEARLTALRLQARQLDDELCDRARRDGALPGWLR